MRHPFLLAAIAFLAITLLVFGWYGLGGRLPGFSFGGFGSGDIFKNPGYAGQNGSAPETVKIGLLSSETQHLTYTIYDQSALLAAWNKIAPGEAAPQIDWNKSMVLAAFMGQKKSGGYSIEISNVETGGGKIAATVKEVSPGPYCAVTQNITSPYHLVRIPRSGEPVVFAVATEVARCR